MLNDKYEYEYDAENSRMILQLTKENRELLSFFSEGILDFGQALAFNTDKGTQAAYLGDYLVKTWDQAGKTYVLEVISKENFVNA
jgi:hypothetical protein